MSARQHATEGRKILEASVGTVLGGRYRVQSVLGSGGMAVVYKAEDSILGRTVALKTLHRRYAETAAFRRRFRQEARAMASLDHQNIVKVYDISHDGEVPFIVAECVTGRDIGELLAERHGRISEDFARKLAAQLLEALAYAHRRGIIHRDIKPSNILITPSGTVKVADFGIARIIEDDEVGEPGEVIGSARYMSPEQLKGREATQQSDIYSVGILLYHCLAGRPPFSGDLRSLIQQQIHNPPTPLGKVNRRVSEGLEAVVMKALQKDPTDRYPSALAMLDDLEGGNSSTEARPAAKKRRKKSRGKLAVVCGTLLLLLGAGTALGASGLGGYVNLGPEVSKQALNQAKHVQTKALDSTKTAGNKSIPVAAKETTQRSGGQLVVVPRVGAYFDYAAERILQNQGFRVRIVYEYQPGYANRGVVWGTNPSAGSMLPEGSLVTVYATPKDFYQPQVQ